MKLFRSTSEAVIDALTDIFGGGRYADKVIEKVLKQNSKWGARDRRFIAETTYNIVRWYRLLQEVSGAKENEYWKLFAAWMFLTKIGLPDWEEFDGINTKQWNARLDLANATRKIRESIPDWMDEIGERELGARWDTELAALNDEAKVVLRTNRLKLTRADLRQVLDESGVDTEVTEIAPDALELNQRQNVFQLDAFKQGLFELQDAGSQLIAPFLRVEPGMRVIDACAGAGGKTLHLAALMNNKGRILAMDPEQWKLDELKKRARRSGAGNIETRTIESTKTIKRLADSADRVLLDVPCSGLGVLRRNPDAKWKLSMDFIDRVKAAQHDILHDYATMVKHGGMLVYSTCSILPSENEAQIAEFLKNNTGFELIDEKKLPPSAGYDGFYMALIKRTAERKNISTAQQKNTDSRTAESLK